MAFAGATPECTVPLGLELKLPFRRVLSLAFNAKSNSLLQVLMPDERNHRIDTPARIKDVLLVHDAPVAMSLFLLVLHY